MKNDSKRSVPQPPNHGSDALPSNDQSPLPRYGLRWNGPAEPVSTEMPDGYWTPWHLAERQRLFDQKEIERLTRERDEAIALGLDHAATLIENRYLRAALEEIGGYDCDNYCKHLSPQPCGKCLPCIARNALSGEHPPSETRELRMADGSPLYEYLKNTVPDSTLTDEWTQGFEECKRRLFKIIGPQLRSEEASSHPCADEHTSPHGEHLVCELPNAHPGDHRMGQWSWRLKPSAR